MADDEHNILSYYPPLGENSIYKRLENIS